MRQRQTWQAFYIQFRLKTETAIGVRLGQSFFQSFFLDFDNYIFGSPIQTAFGYLLLDEVSAQWESQQFFTLLKYPATWLDIK